MEQGREFLGALGEALVAMAPRLAAAILTVLVGWLLAALARQLTVRGIGLAERVYRRYASVPDGGEVPRWRARAAQSVARVIYWIVLIGAVAVAISLLGIDALGRWLDDLIVFLPTLAIGLAIILAGFAFGGLIRDLVSHAAEAGGFRDHGAIGRLAQAALIVCAVLVGAGHMGIDVSLLVNLATVLLAAMLGAFALSFGLATPDHVSNVISARYLQRHYESGDRVRIGEHSGRILEITSRSVILETAEGELQVPARQFSREPVLKLAPEEDSE